jgi:hypothetical protein
MQYGARSEKRSERRATPNEYSEILLERSKRREDFGVREVMSSYFLAKGDHTPYTQTNVSMFLCSMISQRNTDRNVVRLIFSKLYK